MSSSMGRAKSRKFYTRGFSPTPPAPFLPFPPEGDENLAEQVRACLSRAIRGNRKSLEDLALGLSRRLGFPVSHNVLYSFTADSRPGHRFPLEWAAAWIRETGDSSLLRILCEALSLPLPKPGHLDKVQFADARLEADLAAQEAEGLKARILREGSNGS